jgi:ribulose-phosphate 3-epimerase
VHVEVCKHLKRNIEQIKSLGCKAGVALNPHTPVIDLENVIAEIDLVIVMSVNPGFGGQNFIEHTYQKIEQLKNLIVKNNSSAKIEIDGGVNLQNTKRLIEVGADVLVAGNFVFSANNPTDIIKQLKNA